MSLRDVSHDPATLDRELERELRACRELLGPAAGEGDAPDLAPLSHRVRDAIAAERGLAAQIRSLSTPQRVAVVWAVLLALLALAGLVLPQREDLASYPLGRMVVTLLVLVVLAALAAKHLLRPLHVPPAKTSFRAALIAGAVIAPIALVLVPMGHVGVHAGTGMVFVMECVRCAAYGAAMGVPLFVVAMLARRTPVGGASGASVAVLAGLTPALAGNLVLQLQCPNTDVSHQLVAHCSLLLILPAAAVIGGYIWARRTPGTGSPLPR